MKMLVIVLVVVGLGWVYLNRDSLFEPVVPPGKCDEWNAQLNDPDRNIGYEDRARAAANGCL